MTATPVQTAAPAFDDGRAAEFEERLTAALNGGALALMMSIGHRTRLFDAMKDLPPSTPDQIAATTGLNERYVREWLGCMVAGGVVEIDPAAGTYRLPAEHAAYLTRAAESDNLAVFAQYFSVLGGVEDDIIECFHNGGGVPYERFPRFHELMAEDSGLSVLPALHDHILPLVPGLTQRLEQGIQVLDAGCGRGKALNMMAKAYPNSRFVGYDLSAEAIDYARGEAKENGNTNVVFEVRDLSDFDVNPSPEPFDLVTTFDAVHDQAKPLALVRGIRRSLAEDGVYLAQDINASTHHHENVDHPLGALLYTVSCMHCMTVSLAQGGDGLGAMWGRQQAEALFREAGFGSVEVHELEHDVQNAYYICRP